MRHPLQSRALWANCMYGIEQEHRMWLLLLALSILQHSYLHPIHSTSCSDFEQQSLQQECAQELSQAEFRLHIPSIGTAQVGSHSWHWYKLKCLYDCQRFET